jgi:hypothetical protein
MCLLTRAGAALGDTFCYPVAPYLGRVVRERHKILMREIETESARHPECAPQTDIRRAEDLAGA